MLWVVFISTDTLSWSPGCRVHAVPLQPADHAHDEQHPSFVHGLRFPLAAGPAAAATAAAAGPSGAAWHRAPEPCVGPRAAALRAVRDPVRQRRLSPPPLLAPRAPQWAGPAWESPYAPCGHRTGLPWAPHRGGNPELLRQGDRLLLWERDKCPEALTCSLSATSQRLAEKRREKPNKKNFNCKKA